MNIEFIVLEMLLDGEYLLDLWVYILIILACWIGYYSLYNWVFTSIIPPERGVKRKQLSKK
jgi:hypothetical protein